MKNYKEYLIKVIEHSELDMDEPFWSEGENEPNDVESPDVDIYAETVSMDIDEAIETLQQLKELGSNRVYIIAHEDHIGYVFTGVECKEI